MPSQRWHRLPRPDHTHPVAVLEHQAGVGKQDGVAATDFDDLGLGVVGKHDAANRHAGQSGSRHEESRDVQCAAIAHDAPGFDATELLLGLVECRGLTEQQQAIPGVEPNPRIGQHVLPSLSYGHYVHTRRQTGDQFAEHRPRPLACQHHFDGAGRRRRRDQAGPDEAREDEDAEDGCDDTNRIGDGYPTAGERSPAASIAACSAGVLVIAPANRPSACPGDTPNPAPAARATPSAENAPTAPSAFHFSPDPRKPVKNCRPY